MCGFGGMPHHAPAATSRHTDSPLLEAWHGGKELW
jgi:hypothetical protein